MKYPNYVDLEMRELLDVLGAAIVPRSRRKACVKTAWHTPYYSKKRYTRI